MLVWQGIPNVIRAERTYIKFILEFEAQWEDVRRKYSNGDDALTGGLITKEAPKSYPCIAVLYTCGECGGSYEYDVAFVYERDQNNWCFRRAIPEKCCCEYAPEKCEDEPVNETGLDWTSDMPFESGFYWVKIWEAKCEPRPVVAQVSNKECGSHYALLPGISGHQSSEDCEKLTCYWYPVPIQCQG
jgi:hypothetical protein